MSIPLPTTPLTQTPQLQVGLDVFLSNLSCWGFVWLQLTQALIVHAVTIIVSSNVQLSYCVLKTTYIWNRSQSLALSFLCSVMPPETWGEGCNIDVPFRAEHSRVSFCLHINHMWICSFHLLQEQATLMKAKYVLNYGV